MLIYSYFFFFYETFEIKKKIVIYYLHFITGFIIIVISL